MLEGKAMLRVQPAEPFMKKRRIENRRLARLRSADTDSPALMVLRFWAAFRRAWQEHFSDFLLLRTFEQWFLSIKRFQA
jgi:hypothetical protein